MISWAGGAGLGFCGVLGFIPTIEESRGPGEGARGFKSWARFLWSPRLDRKRINKRGCK